MGFWHKSIHGEIAKRITNHLWNWVTSNNVINFQTSKTYLIWPLATFSIYQVQTTEFISHFLWKSNNLTHFVDDTHVKCEIYCLVCDLFYHLPFTFPLILFIKFLLFYFRFPKLRLWPRIRNSVIYSVSPRLFLAIIPR